MNEQMQSLCFLAGANSIFYGCKLLTAENPETDQDAQLFNKLGINTETVADNSATAEKQLKTALVCLTISALLLFMAGCLDIMAYKSKTEIITKGKSIRAPEFKTGTYTDFGDEPKQMQLAWNRQSKEYEIRMQDAGRVSGFRLKHLSGSSYLLQGKEDAHFQYSIITIAGDIVHFLDIKEDYDEQVSALLKKHGLKVNPEDSDDVSGTRKTLIAFFTGLLKKDYLKYGEKIKFVD